MKNRKINVKYLILSVLVLISFASIGIFGYFMYKNRQKVELFQLAMAAYATGNYPQAKIGFVNVLRDDYNNEIALVKLAELAERSGNWAEASYYWNRASSLNAFDDHYFSATIRNMLKCRDFTGITRLLENYKKTKALDAEDMIFEAFSHFMLRNYGKSRELLNEIPDSAKTSSPLAELLEFYLTVGQNSDPEMVDKLIKLSKCGDSVVMFEAYTSLASIYQNNENYGKTEESLKSAATLNPFAGLPLLGEFYSMRANHAAASKAYRDALSFGPSAILATKLGESLAAQNDRSGIIELAKSYRSGNRQALKAGYYLDALAAFLAGDWKTMGNNLRYLDDSFNTPPAIMMRLCLAVYERNSEKAGQALERFSSDLRFRLMVPRAVQITLPFIIGLIHEQKITEAAALARKLEKSGASDIIVSRLVLADNLQKNISVPSEIKKALEKFPEDQVLLGIAAVDALRDGRYREALQYIEKNLKNGFNTVDVRLQHIAALEGLKQNDMAATEFRHVMDENPDRFELIKGFMEFAVRNARINDLEFLVVRVMTSDKPIIRQFAPYVEAEKAFIIGNNEQVKYYLKQADSNYPELVFRAAVLYGLIDELDMGIASYLKIADSFPDRALVQINLSELYDAKGNSSKALEIAEKAWRSEPERVEVLECYGIRLAKSGELDKASLLLEQAMARSNSTSSRAFECWREVQERLLEQKFNRGEYSACRNLCIKLLRRIPDHPQALQYLKKLDEIEKQKVQ
ncbi:MAG: hypothetical protein PHT71_03310 [Victivallaceae bacterium]|nr:hypothetical protein [Victivallaceae bacterium]